MRKAMRLASVLALAGLCLAQTDERPRRIGDDQPLQQRMDGLSAPVRTKVLSAIAASVRTAEEDDYEEPEVNDDIAAIDRGLRYESFGTTLHSFLIVQATGADGCGAVGNCRVYLFSGSGDLWLSTTAMEFTLLSTHHGGLPDILLGSHQSSSQTSETWYVFDTEQYRAVRCATDTYADGKRHREFGKC